MELSTAEPTAQKKRDDAMTNTTQTAALVRYARPTHCPARATAKFIEMHLLCVQFAEDSLSIMRTSSGPTHACCRRNVANWYGRAGAYLERAVEVSR